MLNTIALEDIRIVDWTVGQVGPYATAMLADLGAEVIKVEPAGRGAQQRSMEVCLGVPVKLPKNREMFFEEHNRNKKSLALNLESEKGREIIYRLVKKSDAFVTNIRKQTVDRFSMDYQTLVKHNPKLIYASASGLGRKGPDSERQSIDITACARSGAMMASGEEKGPPVMLALGLGDRTTSVSLAFCIVTALLVRERTGIGQEVHTSQLGTMINLHGNIVTSCLWADMMGGRSLERHNREEAPNSLYNFYKCKDGRWIVLGVQEHYRYWKPVCELLDLAWVPQDSRFNTGEQRTKHRKELVALFDEAFARKTHEEWATIFDERDVLFSKVNSPSDLSSDPQVIANSYIVDWQHPDLGHIKFVGFPYEFSGTPPSLRTPAPETGQHTEEVLSEICGYSWEEISSIREQGII